MAAQRRLDPDKWFNNVEMVKKIGVETTTYVRNIYRYYVAYKLAIQQMGPQQKVKEQLEKGS